MRAGKARITVILNFGSAYFNKREDRFEATEYTVRKPPDWLSHHSVDIYNISLPDGKCFETIGSQLTQHAAGLPDCHVFFEYESGTIDVLIGKIQDYFPSSITILGKPRRATEQEIERYHVVSSEELTRRREAKIAYEKFMEEPALGRFKDIDLED